MDSKKKQKERKEKKKSLNVKIGPITTRSNATSSPLRMGCRV